MRRRFRKLIFRVALWATGDYVHDGEDCIHGCCLQLGFIESELRYFWDEGTGTMTPRDVVGELYNDLGK